eukprot:jgi/Phyca11/117021/e_gw1.32.267.1
MVQAEANVAESSLTTTHLVDKLPAATAKSSAYSAATQCAQKPQEGIKVPDGDEDGHLAVVIQVDSISDTSDDKQTKKSTSKRADKEESKRRVSYTVKQNCLVLHEILGDSGIFNRNGASKTERWVKITCRVSEVLQKDISPEALRKHLDVLVKNHRKKMTKELALSGREPKKSSDEVELESLISQYIERKEDERASNAERIDSRSKKDEQDRIGGEAIRTAALTCEKPKKTKSSRKRADPLEFVKSLATEFESRQERERRERLDREERMQTRVVELQEQQMKSQQQVAEMVAMAMQALAGVLGKTGTN